MLNTFLTNSKVTVTLMSTVGILTSPMIAFKAGWMRNHTDCGRHGARANRILIGDHQSANAMPKGAGLVLHCAAKQTQLPDTHTGKSSSTGSDCLHLTHRLLYPTVATAEDRLDRQLSDCFFDGYVS
jgi:hypothetical protein